MNFDKILTDIILQEALEDNLISLIKLKEPNITEKGISQILNKLKEIDQKKGNDSKRLLEFYYQNGKNWENLTEEYKLYLDLLKKQLVKQDINSFKSFLDFANYVHGLQGSIKKKTDIKVDLPKEDPNNKDKTHFDKNFGDIPLVYKTNEIKIYHARDAKDCIKLGYGLPYTGMPFCISRTSNNLYNVYRRNNGSFYFIFYKESKESLHDSYVMVFNNNGQKIELTFIDNATQTWDINSILNTFPELKDPWNKGILKQVPFTEDEVAKMDLYEECQKEHNIEYFKDLNSEQLREYIEFGYSLDYERLEWLKENKYDNLINDWCTKGIRLDKDIFNFLNDKERNTWKKFRERELKLLREHDNRNGTNFFINQINDIDKKNIPIIQEYFNEYIKKVSDRNTEELINMYSPLIKDGVLEENVDLSNNYLLKIPDIFKGIKVTEYFDCSDNNLTSLENCPSIIGKGFNCSHNQLTSLENCPISVGKQFYCSHNDLTSLEGSPREIRTVFNCSSNELTSLVGGPEKVGGDFVVEFNQLTNLEGSPSIVGGWFYCSNNNLTSLEGSPSIVGGRFYCSNNNLTSLEGIPITIGGHFDCINNPVPFYEEDIKQAMENRRLKESQVMESFRKFFWI